jgi:hypothetical protein
MSGVLRRKYLARIKRKEQEVIELTNALKDLHLQVAEIEASIAEARILVSAWEEIVSDLPSGSQARSEASRKIRPNSNVDLTLKILRQEMKPMHINEIMERLGIVPNKRNRSSLSGTLGPYVREEKVFTRPAPNTFGLKEWIEETKKVDQKMSNSQGRVSGDEGIVLPADFGQRD